MSGRPNHSARVSNTPDRSLVEKARKSIAFGESEIEQLVRDPRLKDWLPRSRHAFFGKVLSIDEISESLPVGPFDRYHTARIRYTVEGDGGRKKRIAYFEKKRSPDLGTMDALSSHVRQMVGAGADLEEQPFSAGIGGGNKLNQALLAIMVCENFLQRIRGIKEVRREHPAVPGLRILETSARMAAKCFFELGMLARELELQAALDQDVSRALRSASGSKKGAKESSNKRADHARAWKSRLAESLQPLIDSESKKKRGGVSRERVAEMAETIWPKKGILGTYTTRARPNRETLMKVLKDMERDKLIFRPSAKPGRKPLPK